MTLSPLSDVIAFKKGKKPKRIFPSPQEGALPYILIESFEGNPKAYTDDTSCPTVKPSDTLLVCDGARTGLSNSGLSGYIGSTLAALIPDETILAPAYLSYFIKGQYDLLNSRTRGAAIPHLDKDLLLGLEIPIPPLSLQQQKIETLTRAESIVRQRKEAERQTAELVASIFLKMFGDPLKNTMGWMVQPLSALGKITTGNTPPTSHKEYYGGENLWVRPAELGSMFPIKHTERTLTAAGLSVARTVRSGAVLVGCIGTIGKVGYATQRVSFNQQINAVEFDQSKVDDIYGYVCLLLMGSYLADKGSQMVVPILNKGNFQKIQIPCPPLEKQSVFAEQFRSLLSIMTLQTQATAKAQELFDALLARAFTAED